MTAAAFGIDTAPGRRGWHALFWLVPLTALWIGLNYAFPLIGASGASTVASRLTVHVMVALGLWLGLERTELSSSQRRNVWLAVMIPFTLWLSVIWSAAVAGAFKPGAIAIPLQPIASLGPVVLAVPVLLRSRRIGEVLDAMPASWIVALQVLRVLGSAFLIGWAYGTVCSRCPSQSPWDWRAAKAAEPRSRGTSSASSISQSPFPLVSPSAFD
jgi:hypothetical protein